MEEGRKDDQGPEKLRWDLIPWDSMQEVAKVYTLGAKKYSDRNWEKGILFSRMWAAMLRHAISFWDGSSKDKDDGQHPLASVVFYALGLIHLESTKPEMDNRKECL